VDFKRPEKGSALYRQILERRLEWDGEQSFKYVGNVFFPIPNKSSYFEPPKGYSMVSPKLYNIMLDLFPDELNGLFLKDNPYTNTKIYPLAEYNAVSRYAGSKIPMDPGGLKVALRMVDQCFSCLKNSPTLQIEDAIRSVPSSTSPGYPWQLVFRTKRDLQDSALFKVFYSNYVNDILHGYTPPMYWRNFIKKELKKKEKVDNHDPRSVLSQPMEGSVLNNQLYLPMNLRMCRAGASMEIPVFYGVTKFNRQWHRLAKRVLRFPNINDGDVSFWDGSVHKLVMQFVRDLRRSWSSHKGLDKLHEYYYNNVIFSMIVGAMGDVFTKTGGMPSGQGNTLADNCIIHVIYWCYHWVMVACEARPDMFKPTWESFKEHCELIVMGDDIIYSYSDALKPYFLPPVVARTFASFGVTLKYSSPQPQSIDEVEFCSMNFKLVKGIYVPVLKHKKILASLCYKDKEEDHPRILLRRMMSLRIEGFYDDKFMEILNALIPAYISEHKKALLSPLPIGKDGKPIGNDNQTFDQIMALQWSDALIEDLYMYVDE